MHRAIRIISAAFVVMVVSMGSSFAAPSADGRSEILKAREAVWRAWFANDTKTLQKLVPPDTIVISAGEDKWKTQADVLQSAADFRKEGGRLIRLEFPRSEIPRALINSSDIVFLMGIFPLVAAEPSGESFR